MSNRLAQIKAIKFRAAIAREQQLTNYIVDGKRGCWNWQGLCNNKGYGILTRDRKSHKAHRLFYEIHVGPIPTGMLVCHECDNPTCVNPKHLFLGTIQDNNLDCKAKGRRPYQPGELAPSVKLTELAVFEIRASGESQRSLAKRFGVNRRTIQRILTGETWSHLGEGE